jgi:hypothetical protein
VCERQGIEHLIDIGASVMLAPTQVERTEADLLADVAGDEHVIGVLHDQSDLTSPRSETFAVVSLWNAVERDRAGLWTETAIEMQQQGGLSTSVRAEQRDARAGLDLKRATGKRIGRRVPVPVSETVSLEMAMIHRSALVAIDRAIKPTRTLSATTMNALE